MQEIAVIRLQAGCVIAGQKYNGGGVFPRHLLNSIEESIVLKRRKLR